MVEVTEVGVEHSEAGDVAQGRAAGGWEWGNGGSCWFWFESLLGNSCAGHLGGECWTITAWSRKHLQQQNVSKIEQQKGNVPKIKIKCCESKTVTCTTTKSNKLKNETQAMGIVENPISVNLHKRSSDRSLHFSQFRPHLNLHYWPFI